MLDHMSNNIKEVRTPLNKPDYLHTRSREQFLPLRFLPALVLVRLPNNQLDKDQTIHRSTPVIIEK